MAEGVLALLALEEWRSEHTHSYDNGEFGRLSMSVCTMMSLKDVILHSLSLSYRPFLSVQKYYWRSAERRPTAKSSS